MRCVCGCWDDEHELIEPGEAPGACTSCGCDGFLLDVDDQAVCDDTHCSCMDDGGPRGRPVITVRAAGGLL